MAKRLGAILALLVLLVAPSALAQTTGDIDGTVADQNGQPLPGVTLELKSPALIGGSRTVVTDGAGRFRFKALNPGTYSVTASLTGFGKVEKSTVPVRLGATATVPITMSVSKQEEIVVTGEAPVVDVTRTTIGTNATLDTIQRLPLGRNFASIASTVAGTGSDVSGNVTVYGATGLENAYIVDGVNTTGPKTGTQTKQLNNEFVQEVEVKTGGYEAEYGRVLGGTINVITKSGGNDFHGDVFGYYDSDSLASDADHQDDLRAAQIGQYYTPKRLDMGLDLGGYFVKDRVWFFGAYDRVNQDQEFQQPESQTRNAAKTVNFFTGTDTVRNNLYSGKLTFRLGEANTVAASVFGDPGKQEGRLLNAGVNGTIIGPASGLLGSNDTGGADFSLKYDGIFGTQFLVQAQFGYHEDGNDMSSPFANTVSIERQQFGFENELIAGSGPRVLTNETFRRYVYKAAATWFLGSNEIKVGLDWEHLNSSYFQQYGGRDRLRLRLTADGAYRNTQHRYYAVTPIANNCTKKVDNAQPYSIFNCLGYNVSDGVRNSPRNDNTAFFVQDSFKILKNLTINAGIRYEQQNLKDEIGLAPIDIKNEWAPRLGVVWDFLNNGKSKLYANYGRFYEVIPQDIQTRALGNEYIIFVRNTTQNAVDPINTVSFPYAPVQGGEIVQDDLKGMYQDEIIGGIEFEVAPNWAVGVKGIYKALGTVVEDRCDVPYNPDIVQFFKQPDQTCALINPGEGNALGTIKDPTDRTCYPNGYVDADGAILPGSPCESTRATRFFRGVELTATHRFANNFYVLGSYLYSKLEGSYSGNLSQTREFGQTDPNINADFDYPGLLINAYGKLRNDRTHQVKLSGYYAFPFGLNAGLSASYASGRPYSIRGCSNDPVACPAGYNQEGYLLPRGSAGTLPSITQADLHLEYAVRFSKVSITPIVDVINLFNSQSEVSREELFNNTGDLASNAPCANGKWEASCAPNPRFGKSIAFQPPRVIRIGARLSF